MSVLRVMGTETEYGISVPGQPGANAMVTSSQIVNAYQAATAARARRARWDFEEENPLRDARGFDLTRGGGGLLAAHRRGPGPGQRHPDQRRAAVRRPRAPGVLGARVHEPAVGGDLGQGRRAGHGGGRGQGRDRAGQRAHPAVQEQHRQQGRLLRLARELPDAPRHAVRRHRQVPRPVLRLPPGDLRRRPGRHRRRRPRAPASRSASAPTSSRSRSAWRPRSSGPSSTPGTSRTPTRRSTGGCT